MGLKELYTATGAKIFGTASTVKTIGAAAAASAVIAGAAAGVHAFTSGRDFTPDGAGRAIRTNQVHFDGSENTIGKQDEQTKNGESEIYERDESAEEKQKPQTGDSASYLFENVKQQEKPSGLLDRDGTAAAIAGTVPTAGAASVQPGTVLDIVKDPAAADIVLHPGSAAQAAPPTGGDTANSGGNNTAQPSVTPANPSTGGETTEPAFPADNARQQQRRKLVLRRRDRRHDDAGYPCDAGHADRAEQAAADGRQATRADLGGKGAGYSLVRQRHALRRHGHAAERQQGHDRRTDRQHGCPVCRSGRQ